MKAVLKTIAGWIATVLVAPEVASFYLRKQFVGGNCALEASSQLLSLLPGLTGAYLRNAFLRQVLAECHVTARVEFGVLFSKIGARLGRHCYVGPRCCLGLVDLEEDVLLGAGVHVPSGARIHGTADANRPIREQVGTIATVRIGAGTWVGANAVVMADVGRNCVIGAGSVVTQTIPDNVVAAGVPARILRSRTAAKLEEVNEIDETQRLPALSTGAVE
jgi:virginiamycin A acetyltransferase